jgi:2-keto-4-pentenoate hydratase
MTFDEEAAIDSFWQAGQRGAHFPAAWFDRLSLDQAYRVQLGLVARRCRAGERQIGWKVGLTAEPIQQQFGFHEPVFGCVLDSKPSGHVFGPDELTNPGFENELCFKVNRPLAGEIALPEARAAIELVYSALEITETRGDLSAQIAVAIADNAQQKTVILGEPVVLAALALEEVEVAVAIDGVTVATGKGSAVLGNPLNSVIWLARKLPQFGRCIEAGDIIMSGSFTRQFPIQPGNRIRAVFSGIGSVEVEMACRL